MTSPGHEHLAVLVQKRRTELRLGVEPAAKLGGISKDTWKRVEAGLKVWDRSYAGIDTALQWAVGSCQRILSGNDPLPVERADEAPDVAIAILPKTELARVVGDAVTHAALGIKGELTAEKILDLNERVAEQLRERGVI
ncbi:hypothetical protein SGFS_013670 [Streptomyces graminofaciens]|uniref:XRE family transcriptional regulator n=1 Tax=Streptomyces graminofaciens TaxID=68212 RepID=A0ABM7F2S2_9ACTN|nr:hypothetical protein [Streptomyces graminofaciens]BBC30073.1 hypothetical protein SGFS_013670 [Streptomyces graminofaciens]